MDIFELIQQRRTVSPNQYSKQPITEEELQKILESANWAPTHKIPNLGGLRLCKEKAG